MSLASRLLVGSALTLVAALPAAAQAPKFSGLVQVWYNQVLDNNLRLNSLEAKGGKYYSLRSEFKENGFTVRRTEIKLSGSITDDVSYEVMFDPSIGSGSILQDAAISYKLFGGLEFKVGQFKSLQTMEGLTSSSELLLVERNQMGRTLGDDRQRGGVLSLGFGDKNFGGKLHAGVFNGAGKANETQGNVAKDFVLRADFTMGSTIKFGAYTLQGSTDVADTKGMAIASNPGAPWPTQADIYDNKDKTTNMGAYAAYQDDTFYGAFEVITGELGRRYATLAAATPSVKREHLGQKFMGMALTGGYTVGNHTFLARFDTMNYNSGDQWYTATNPYITAGVDYSPKFTETTLGYLYAFKPEKLKAANLKVNFVNRSKNFLAPRAGQTGAQGGNTLIAAFQISF